MAKVKVFVYAGKADAGGDARAMALAPPTFIPARYKCGRNLRRNLKFLIFFFKYL